ncbi:MAG: VWA domain-containing protein [Halobacteriaceae archaeon]
MTRKLHGSIRAATVVVVALLVTLAFTIPAAAVYDPAEDGDVQPDPNNPFPQVCGANVVLALDNSASLDRQNRTDLKNAANQTAAVLANSSAVSGLGIVEFNGKSGTTDDADTVIGITKLQSQSDVQTVQNAIATITAPDTETLTNWEAGLAEASQSANDEDGDVPNEDLNKPADIVILVSDGRPNAYGYNDTTVFDQSGALEAATKAANIVKSEGTRVIGVGFPGSDGNLPPENPFRQITNGSSSVTGAADDQANDYYIVDKSSDLSSVLTMIAEEFDCSVAVEKRNDANGDGTFTDEETAPEPNAPVEYQVEITNTGQISLTIDDYVDDIYGDVTLSQDIVGDVLAPGETRTVTFTGEAPGENGMKVNTFTVDASGSDGFQVSDSDTTTVNSPDLTPSITVDHRR